MLSYSEIELAREPQLRHSEYLVRCGRRGLAYRLIKCADSWALAVRMGREYPVYQCDSRYCEYCGPRRAARFRRTYGPVLESLVNEGYRLSHLVLTTRNIPELERGHSDRLLQAFNKILRSNPLKGRVAGAFAQYEIEFNDDWHAHLHVILIYKKCIEQPAISEAWYRLTGSRQVDIRKLLYDSNDLESVHNSISTIMNYVCKHTSFDDRAFERVFESTYNKKLVRTYGLIRKRYNGIQY